MRVVGGAGLEGTMDGEEEKGVFDAVETAVELLRRGARQRGAFRVSGLGFRSRAVEEGREAERCA